MRLTIKGGLQSRAANNRVNTVLSGDSGWQVRDVDVEEKGARTDPCDTPFLRCRNLLRVTFLVVRVKLRLPTISMITRTICV